GACDTSDSTRVSAITGAHQSMSLRFILVPSSIRLRGLIQPPSHCGRRRRAGHSVPATVLCAELTDSVLAYDPAGQGSEGDREGNTSVWRQSNRAALRPVPSAPLRLGCQSW